MIYYRIRAYKPFWAIRLDHKVPHFTDGAEAWRGSTYFNIRNVDNRRMLPYKRQSRAPSANEEVAVNAEDIEEHYLRSMCCQY